MLCSLLLEREDRRMFWKRSPPRFKPLGVTARVSSAAAGRVSISLASAWVLWVFNHVSRSLLHSYISIMNVVLDAVVCVVRCLMTSPGSSCVQALQQVARRTIFSSARRQVDNKVPQKQKLFQVTRQLIGPEVFCRTAGVVTVLLLSDQKGFFSSFNVSINTPTLNVGGRS